MPVAKGQELDKYLTMYSDFFSNSIDFMVKNIDKVLMMTIICFLLRIPIVIRANSSPTSWANNLIKRFVYKIFYKYPKKIIFNTECSSINVVCKAGDLYGTHGVIKETNNSPTENMIITSGIGYLFDRAVDTITPMGTLMNFMSYEQASCDLNREIIVVLE